jgi:hypothetical protein
MSGDPLNEGKDVSSVVEGLLLHTVPSSGKSR